PHRPDRAAADDSHAANTPGLKGAPAETRDDDRDLVVRWLQKRSRQASGASSGKVKDNEAGASLPFLPAGGWRLSCNLPPLSLVSFVDEHNPSFSTCELCPPRSHAAGC